MRSSRARTALAYPRREAAARAGAAVELDIEIWPTCIVVPAGYRVALTIRGKDYEYAGERRTLSNMKNPMKGCGPFVHDDRPTAAAGVRRQGDAALRTSSLSFCFHHSGHLDESLFASLLLGLLRSLTGSPIHQSHKNHHSVPAGNTTDIMTRLIGPKVAERLGQQIVVENRPGASGMLGLDLSRNPRPTATRSPRAGRQHWSCWPHTSRNIPYDPLKDFVPIAVTTTTSGHRRQTGWPFKSIGEMVAYAKAIPAGLTVATNGEGGFPHLAFEHLRTLGGFSFTHRSVQGSAAIATDIIGGQVQAGIDGITGMTPHIKSGRLRLLAVTNPTPSRCGLIRPPRPRMSRL